MSLRIDPAHTRSKRIAALSLSLAVGLAAAGCGASTTSDNKTSDAKESGGRATFGPEEFALSTDELASRIEDVEAQIGTCMTEAGFEYVPVDFEQVSEAMSADKSAPGLSDERFVEEFGYGITTQFERSSREIGLGEQNMAIYEGLSPAEQVAYDHTLFGDDAGATFAITLEAEDFSMTGGCTRTAVESTFTAAELASDYFNPGDRAIEQDERMVDAIANWSECVSQEGHDYAHPDEVEEDLAERLTGVTEGVDPASLSGPAADALAELQGYERAVAKVSTTCEEDHIEPVAEDVEAEIYGAPQN